MYAQLGRVEGVGMADRMGLCGTIEAAVVVVIAVALVVKVVIAAVVIVAVVIATALILVVIAAVVIVEVVIAAVVIVAGCLGDASNYKILTHHF